MGLLSLWGLQGLSLRAFVLLADDWLVEQWLAFLVGGQGERAPVRGFSKVTGAVHRLPCDARCRGHATELTARLQRSVQTAAASQKLMHAARAATTSVLLGTLPVAPTLEHTRLG